MTNPKPGLGPLARQDGTSYPVKKKGQPRRLLPNRDGIAWLESDDNDFDLDTEIDRVSFMDAGLKGLLVQQARGAEGRPYSRPMFEILGRDAFHTAPQEIDGADTCCYDFHRTWACPDHPEVPYDGDRKKWLNPAQLRQDADATEAYARLGRCTCGCQGEPLPTVSGFADWGHALDLLADESYGSSYASLQDETITLNGFFNPATLRPVTGTPCYWTLTVEAETEQSRGRLSSIEIEVDPNG